MSHGTKIINLKINSLRFEHKQFVRRVVIMSIIRLRKNQDPRRTQELGPDDNSLSNSAGFGVFKNK